MSLGAMPDYARLQCVIRGYLGIAAGARKTLPRLRTWPEECAHPCAMRQQPHRFSSWSRVAYRESAEVRRAHASVTFRFRDQEKSTTQGYRSGTDAPA